MAEIRTFPVVAIHVPEKNDFQDEYHRGKIPGSFRVTGDGEDLLFWYCCPCGCKEIGVLKVGKNYKPEQSPSWNWNGSFEKSDLKPSVHWKGHWHGWLNNGTWESC